MTPNTLSADDKSRIRKLGELTRAMRESLSNKLVGLDEIIEQVMIGIFSGGHCLLVGVPGLAKTLLVRSVAELLELNFARIQFTPDLMPSDITGTEILTIDLSSDDRVFQFVKGPIFANIVLADEINRTPPKTQAALMEAMEERQVTSAGKRYVIEPPFFVLATQNPIEQEGTYPLPVAQLDRFMFNIRVDYPSWEEEERIVILTTSGYQATLEPLLDRQQINDYTRLARCIHMPEPVMSYAIALARSTRRGLPGCPGFIDEWLSWGAGPRAGHFLLLGGKARAMLDGRFEVNAADVRSVAKPVFRHRLLLNYHAEAEHVTTDDIVDGLLAHVAAPDGWRPSTRPAMLVAR